MKSAIAYATHLSEGVTELSLLRQNKWERLTEFMHVSVLLGIKIDEINYDFVKIYE